MPTKIKIIKQKSPQKSGKKKSKRRVKQTKMMTATPSKEIVDYARLLRDPCNGPLVRAVGSLHQGAITERLRITDSSFLDGIGYLPSKANGYIVWFPSYHSSGTFGGSTNVAYTPANLFYYHSTSSSTPPTNTVVDPAGLGTGVAADGASTTGTFLRDPANNQLLGATTPFDRATTLSACLQADYIGVLSALSGQVCTVSNFSLASFITNSGVPGAIPAFPSVDTIFSYAAKRERLHPAGAEVIWRPTDQSSIPRTGGQMNQGNFVSDSPIVDAPFWTGSKGVHTTRVVATNPNEVFGVCVAWKGVPVSGLSFNMVKVVNLELAARSAQIEEIRTGTSSALPSISIDAVVNAIDSASPGWQSSLSAGAHSMASSIGRGAMDAVMNRASGIVSDVGPLLTNVVSGGMPFQARRSLRMTNV